MNLSMTQIPADTTSFAGWTTRTPRIQISAGTTSFAGWTTRTPR